MSIVQTDYDTEAVVSTVSDKAVLSSTTRYKSVHDSVELWLKLLPVESSMPVVPAEKAFDVAASSMDRCLAREIMKAIQVLSIVRKDLELVRYVVHLSLYGCKMYNYCLCNE